MGLSEAFQRDTLGDIPWTQVVYVFDISQEVPLEGRCFADKLFSTTHNRVVLPDTNYAFRLNQKGRNRIWGD